MMLELAMLLLGTGLIVIWLVIGGEGDDDV